MQCSELANSILEESPIWMRKVAGQGPSHRWQSSCCSAQFQCSWASTAVHFFPFTCENSTNCPLAQWVGTQEWLRWVVPLRLYQFALLLVWKVVGGRSSCLRAASLISWVQTAGRRPVLDHMMLYLAEIVYLCLSWPLVPCRGAPWSP